MPQSAIRQYEEDEHLPSAEVDQQAVSEAETEEAEEAVAIVESPTTDNVQDEPYYHYTVDTKDPDPWLIVHKTKIIVLVIFAAAAVAGGMFYKDMKLSEQTKAIIAAPQLNDFYYVDFRVIKDNLRPAEKFRMAKVKDITGDVVTINFSSYFYFQEHELNEAIRYAQLRYEKFFQEKRHNYKISELQTMIESGAIVLARRPEGNMLDGNVVVPDSHFESSSVFIPGKKENFSGLEYLKFATDGDKMESALIKFEESADLGFAKGQVNLAQMYLNGMAVQKDLHESLAWLKKAALQAYEPAILKYEIVCQQVESCAVADFYEELVKAGVNIEFTKQADVRATTKAFEKALEDAKK
ncbi:tetratricopeptide repeat protein [Colwellia psychrerythraea]|uniref:Sel1 domain protein repeat-containing protein n=1 Tax=Colwellia psychrerythraea TaxID=28229 RepID=A0A099KBN8_COLPS|nr:sel1 repeat family protein [Colwellia psychrerythraea]KGJ87725.1 Sel1 domain protein repeat-containing protein [Colwellia psychrerythraea]